MTNGNGTLLRVRDLRTYFDTDDGVVQAVDGVSFRIDRGRTFALVGESGCGKSVTAYSILKLLPMPPGRIAAGSVAMDRRELVALGEKQMQHVRGRQISMIFQEPMTSLNPVFTCGSQIVEAIRLHRRMSRKAAAAVAIDLLGRVGIPDPAQRFGEYPHQLSGGMRQRVMIAMALSCDPQLLIADEPTTALDVTIQAQILDLLRELQTGGGLSIMLITHDLAVVAETAHTVAVMYASKIVELCETAELFAAPLHPYTAGLFRSVPRLGQRAARLETISGTVPTPTEAPPQCRFHPRCELTRARAAEADAAETVEIATPAGSRRVLRRCAECTPPLREVRGGHWVACWEVAGYADAPETDPSEDGDAAATTPANAPVAPTSHMP
ncbi:MAG: ABC transporter ATP-binding protein [Phycisphaerae bacterium]|nr:ABC transporter ATP-binding protein [Phycisphaerae bacterium]